MGALFAAAPPANTVIGNQASATYTDPNGAAQLATSNLVETTVQQVGSFTLDGANNGNLTGGPVQNVKVGAAGATVYAPHVLTNTGNGTDGFDISVAPDASGPFSKVEVFADTNGDGVPDGAALCTSVPTAACSIPTQSVAGNNGTFQFVVAYTLPGTATTPTTPYSFGTVSASVAATSPVLATYTSTQTNDVDQVNLTTVAAFNVTKSLSTPAVAAVGGGAWTTLAPTSGPRSSSGACSTTYAAGMTSSASCQYTVYTLTVSNTGGAAGRFVLTDTLPSGFTYVSGSSVWSNNPGNALNEAGVPSGGIDYQVSGNTVTAVIQNLPVNVTQTISMVVLVNNTAAIGTSTTTNVAAYNPSDAPGATTTAPGTTGSNSNPAAFTVTPTYGFAIGSTASTPITALDTTAGTPNAGAVDTTTQAQVAPGGSVSFANTVYNTGNDTDTIDLSVLSNTFPAGTTFQFFAADGVTPLLNTSGNSNVDTGPIPAGGSVNIVVKAILPASAVVGSGPFNATVIGTSAASPSLQAPGDATLEEVTVVVGSLVDLTNTATGSGSGSVANGDLGPGPSPLATTVNTTQAGVGTVFDLFIKNNDTSPNTYNLAASQSTSFPGSLPVGWTVKFVANGGTCASPAITDTGLVAAGAQVQVEACVTPPASAIAATTTIYFQAQSQNAASTGVIVQDAKTDAVTVTAPLTYSSTLDPSNSGQANPGGTVVYAHTLTATGTQQCDGPYTIGAVLSPADVAAGWTTALYLDVDGDGLLNTAVDTLITGSIPGPIAAGANQKILVKVFAPGNATAGATSTVTVTATWPVGATSCGAPSTTDQTTVITGQIRVQKDQAIDADCDGVADTAFAATQLTGKPGQCIVYQVVATNQGAAPVTNLIINDAIPAFTSLSGTQPASQCTSTGITGTAPAFTSTATAVSCGSAANSVAPGGSATMTFAVEIDS